MDIMVACGFSGVGTIDSKELLAQFKAHLLELGLSQATVVNYLADLRAFLRWSEISKGAEVTVFRLGASDIRAYCVFLQDERDHAPATINRRIQALRKFYTCAVAQGWTITNPADEVSLLNETVSQRSRFLTHEDVSHFLAAVRQGRRRWADRDWAIIQAFLGAGLKLSELTQLLLVDVHLDADEPDVVVRGLPYPRGGQAQGAAGEPARVVPLDAEVCRALLDYLPTRRAAEGVEHFFINRDGNPLSTRSVQRLLRHYARTADLDELTTQALRYVYARKAYEGSRDAEAVARLLGHRHLATTVRYLRPGAPQPSAERPAMAPGQRDIHSESSLDES